MRDAQIQRGRRKKRFRVDLVAILMAVIVILLTVIVVLLVKNSSHKDGSSVQSSSLQGQSSSTDTASSVGNNSSSNAGSSKGNVSSKSGVSSVTGANATAGDKNGWNLKLANKENPLPSDFTVAVSNITAKYARDMGMKFDSRAVDALNSMCAAADKDGISLLVISSYRTVSRQTQLYNNEIANQKSKNPSYTDEQAKTAAATVVAIPGTSDHNLGLGVDFNSDQQTFEFTNQFKWLKEHAVEYGFVLRYPKDKNAKTGIIYEPWHYRYVGVEDAKRMNEKNLCLEEYIDYLKSIG